MSERFAFCINPADTRGLLAMLNLCVHILSPSKQVQASSNLDLAYDLLTPYKNPSAYHRWMHDYMNIMYVHGCVTENCILSASNIHHLTILPLTSSAM